MAKGNHEAGDVEERVIYCQRAFVADDQSSEIAQPGESAFDFPSTAITSQCPTILSGRLTSFPPVWAHQLNTDMLEPTAQRIAVVGPVGDKSLRFALGSTSTLPWHPHLLERALHQRHLGRRGAVQEVSQRNTLAVDHHHPLRALAALGFADAVAPFLAGAKLPSMNASLQSN